MLQTRESMRRVWIAGWWDTLRQDAHFTWRSWRRRPAFALAATGLFFGFLESGAFAMPRAVGVPTPLVAVIQGLTMIFILSAMVSRVT